MEGGIRAEVFEVFFTQASPVIGVSPCKEKHMKHTFEFASSAKMEAPRQKVITFLYQKNEPQSEVKAQKIQSGLLLITSEEGCASSLCVGGGLV